jgi:hypothetical protein
VRHIRPYSYKADESGQVLPFRRRLGQALLPPAIRPADPSAEPIGDLARFEQEHEEPVDYRQRMLMNVIALAIVTLLVGTGVWITDTIAEIQKDQDCVMQGRSNCAPIETPAPKQR